MSDPISLRSYRPQDLRSIARVDTLCFTEPFRFSRSTMRRFAEQGDSETVVAETLAGAVVGFIIVQVRREDEGTSGYVVTLDVLREHRRMGLARRLMQEAEQRAHRNGARNMTLHVWTENHAALCFYEREGYRLLSFHAGFYGVLAGRPLDAFTFGKLLEEQGRY